VNRFISRFQLLSSTKQFLVARTFYDWAIYVFDVFYMTYIFKESGSVQEVVMNIFVTLFMVLIGLLAGSFTIRKFGVELNFRLSFVLYVLTGLLGIYLGSIGITAYLLISVFRGIAEGFFWASSNMVEMVGLPKDSRGRFYSISYAFNRVFDIVLPVTLGYLLIKMNSLIPIFVIFTGICLAAAVVPYRFNINNKATIRWTNFKKILRHKRLKEYTFIKTILSASWMVDWLLWSLVPFVILGDELNMGIFLTVASVLGIVASVATNKIKIKRKARIAGPFMWLNAVADIVLLVWFTPVMLYVNACVYTISDSFAMPVEYDFRARLTNSLDVSKSVGLELNIIQEAVYTIGRALIALIMTVLYVFSVPLMSIIQVLVLLLIATKVANYYLSARYLGIKLFKEIKQ